MTNLLAQNQAIRSDLDTLTTELRTIVQNRRERHNEVKWIEDLLSKMIQ